MPLRNCPPSNRLTMMSSTSFSIRASEGSGKLLDAASQASAKLKMTNSLSRGGVPL